MHTYFPERPVPEEKHINRSPHKHPSEHYTKHLKDMVLRHEGWIFQEFGYSRDPKKATEEPQSTP